MCNIIGLSLSPQNTQNFASQGIYTQNCQTPLIYVNSVGATGGNTDNRVEGIHPELCPGSYVWCNDISTVGRAIMCGGIMDVPATSLIKNNMTSSFTGFEVGFGKIGPQGTLSSPNDNQ